jgi:glycosyltransferase involved in cell wall biosynthesis
MVDDGPPLAPYHYDTLKGAREALCLTRWAAAQLGDLGIPLHYLPHTIDTDTFKPGSQVAARSELELPASKFLVLFCGEWEGWPGRKGLIETVEAFARLGDEVGWDRVAIMVQSKPVVDNPPMTLLQLRENFRIPSEAWFQETTHHSLVGRSRAHMARLYQAADVLCLPSRAEAFGLTSVEAEACGTLAVTTKAHASDEVSFSPEACRVHPRGRLISWKLSQWATVDTEDVFRALKHVYLLSPAQRQSLGHEASQDVERHYSRDVNQRRWHSALTAMERRLCPEMLAVRVSTTLRPKAEVIIPTVDGDSITLKPLTDRFAPYDCVVVDDRKKAGFPVAVNFGTRGSGASPMWVLIWNDDCIPDDSMMEELLRAANEHNLDTSPCSW